MRVLLALIGVSVVLAAGVPSASLAANVSGCERFEVHATRASIAELIESSGNTWSGSVLEWSISYSTSASGPWVVAGEDIVLPGEFFPGERTVTVQHLTPETPYFVRCIARDKFGEGDMSGSFSTTAVGPPEVERLQLDTGTTFANFEATVQGNGAEASYRVLLGSSEAEVKGEVAGREPAVLASGVVSEAEDFKLTKAHASGLTPDTVYFMGVEAVSSACMPRGQIPVPGRPACPLVVQLLRTRFVHPSTVSHPVKTVTANSARVEGAVYPGTFETHWWFEVATSENGPWSRVTDAEGTIPQSEADETNHQVTADVGGLRPLSVYYVRLNAENNQGPATSFSGGALEAGSFETGGAPRASTFAVHAIHDGAVRLLGSVSPDGSDTHYHFQYVTNEKYGECGWNCADKTESVDAGPGSIRQEQRGSLSISAWNSQVVGEDLPRLEAGKAYRFRIVASNANGDAVVDEQMLTVPVVVPVSGEGQPRACPNSQVRNGLSVHLPDCRAFEQVTPVEKGGANEMFVYGFSENAGALVGQDGEHVMFAAQFTHWGTGNGPYYFARAGTGWSLTAGAPLGEAGINRYAPEVFDSNLSSFAFSSSWATSSSARSQSREFRTGPVGGPYATLAKVRATSPAGWVASSADFRHLVLEAGEHRLCGHDTGTPEGEDLYDFSRGECHQVNVDSAGATIGLCGAQPAHSHSEGVTRHSVSDDGSRIFFEASPGSNCSVRRLYVRIDDVRTVDLGESLLVAVDNVGKRVVLERNDGELHEFLLHDVDKGQNVLMFSTREESHPVVSSDFTAVYFFSREAVGGEAPAHSELDGLYRYDIAGHGLRFVVEAQPTSPIGPEGLGFAAAPSEVSADGRYDYFAATEVAGLPASGVSPIRQGARSSQLFRFDNVENVVECVSCASSFNPEPRLDVNDTGGALGTNFNNHYEVPRSLFSSDDGRFAFFSTASALVPQDDNGEVPPSGATCPEGACPERPGGTPSTDVYEWRAAGVDGCTLLQGCVNLITPGTDGFLVALLGTTESGGDVFFTTRSRLLGQDKDTADDIYDARIDGGFAEPSPLVQCEGDACQSPIAAPIDTTPSSLSFFGPGNSRDRPNKIKPKHTKRRHHGRRHAGRRRGVRRHGRRVSVRSRGRR